MASRGQQAGGGVPRWDPGAVPRRSRLHGVLRLIRVEHTLFSLPFAYAGAALTGLPLNLKQAVLIGLALFGLRTAAMAFNNIADLDIDRANPRSRSRPLVQGTVSLKCAWALVAVGSLLYYASSALLNRYALLLSPLLWVLALTYPYAKRYHSFPHYHLGLVLGFAVFGGAVAVAGSTYDSLARVLECVPWLYVFGVTLWVAGFDIIYSIMDMDFDRRMGLGSVPALLGARGALLVAIASHVLSTIFFLAGSFTYHPPAGLGTLVSSLTGGALMLYADLMVARSLENIPRAFNLNLVIGLVVSLGVLLDYAVYLLHH
ncbi:MAG: putative 4-hydroxybenzoate polyprenyltransferase [Desulfurococcales archaeon]|nr:putative 4-hydroxybenzoate polyprenyltransferase [Desulfurococcales archaeon]